MYIYIWAFVLPHSDMGLGLDDQLGPQQLKYMTFLRDSSDRCCFALSSLLIAVLATLAGDDEESLFRWEKDLRLVLAWWWIDLMV